jgi:ABC-type multidrug transport system ATPase subunit
MNSAQQIEAGSETAGRGNVSPLISVQGVCKSFRSNSVLQNVSFSVREAEVLGLIGPNGAGKTTLFECLAGLIPTDSGRISFHDHDLAPGSRKKALYYIPDNIRPWADQTVSFVISFFQAMHGRKHDESATLASSLQLEELLQRRVLMLSKGEAKRFLLLLGLLTHQPVLLVDEPFDGLDLRQTREVMSLLRAHAAKGRTLFVSIHQLTDAARVCDRLVLLSSGCIVGEGTLDELSRKAGIAEGGLEEVFLALT